MVSRSRIFKDKPFVMDHQDRSSVLSWRAERTECVKRLDCA
jgi:hypothetical protein